MSTRAGRPYGNWEAVVYGLFILSLVSIPVIAVCDVLWVIDRVVQIFHG